MTKKYEHKVVICDDCPNLQKTIGQKRVRWTCKITTKTIVTVEPPDWCPLEDWKDG